VETEGANYSVALPSVKDCLDDEQVNNPAGVSFDVHLCPSSLPADDRRDGAGLLRDIESVRTTADSLDNVRATDSGATCVEGDTVEKSFNCEYDLDHLQAVDAQAVICDSSSLRRGSDGVSVEDSAKNEFTTNISPDTAENFDGISDEPEFDNDESVADDDLASATGENASETWEGMYNVGQKKRKWLAVDDQESCVTSEWSVTSDIGSELDVTGKMADVTTDVDDDTASEAHVAGVGLDRNADTISNDGMEAFAEPGRDSEVVDADSNEDYGREQQAGLVLVLLRSLVGIMSFDCVQV
jgi:hypothetical protein